jgi:hypothetical protein
VIYGKRKTFAKGKVSMPYKQFLGYEKEKSKFETLQNLKAKRKIKI